MLHLYCIIYCTDTCVRKYKELARAHLLRPLGGKEREKINRDIDVICHCGFCVSADLIYACVYIYIKGRDERRKRYTCVEKINADAGLSEN